MAKALEPAFAKAGGLSPDELLDRAGGPGVIQKLAVERLMSQALRQFGRNVRSRPELLDVRSLSGGGLLLELAFETDPKVSEKACPDEVWRALLKPGQSVSDLRQQVRDEMAAAEELARLEAIWKLLKEQVVSIAVTEGVTPSLRRMAASRMIRQQLRRIQEQLRLPAEQLVKLGAQEDVDEFVARHAAAVEEEARAQLALEEIARAQEIRRYVAIVKEAAQGPPGRYLHDPYARQQISHYLLLDSVVAWLEHYGRIESA
ncbi:hypothetical protein QBZ16_002181 [Prototheca wickerhamii]|uniref:Uncharacterized protein n=1 Tax=Prototheca wickerhamii TaxID=3111 RepID=A0AAD9MNX1_PROWI|nr:hypothetical protein QBZ16_002181 [Prototheca wickerhamii]